MKKVILNTLIMGLAIMMPIVVKADENTTNNTTNTTGDKITIKYNVEFKEVGSGAVDATNNTTTRTYDIYVLTSQDVNLEEAEIEFSYETGTATKSLDCKDGKVFVLDNKEGTNPITCSYKIPAGQTAEKGKSFKVGTLVQVVDNTGKDCTIGWRMGEFSSKINPETGSSVPYALIVGGVAAAGVIYFATQKKNKMYKI